MGAETMMQSVLVGEALDAADYVVLVADRWMHYVAVTRAAAELLGYSRDELLALRIPDVVVESNAEELFEEFLRVRAQRGTVTLRAKDGREIVCTYDAREASLGGLPLYVSVLTPASASTVA